MDEKQEVNFPYFFADKKPTGYAFRSHCLLCYPLVNRRLRDF